MFDHSNYYYLFPDYLQDRLDFVYYHPSFDAVTKAGDDLLYPLHCISEYVVKAWTGAQLKTRDSKQKLYPYGKVENVVNNRIVITPDSEFLSEDEFTSLSRVSPKPGSLLVTRVASFGRCAVVPPGFKCVISDNVLCFELDERVEPDFLSRFINSTLGQAQLRRSVAGMGRGVLTYDRIGELFVGIPFSREEQQNIVTQVKVIETHAADLQNEAYVLREQCKAYLLSELGIILPEEERVEYYYLQFDDLKSQISYGYYHPMLKRLLNNLDNAKYKNFPLGDLVELDYDCTKPRETPEKEYTYIGLEDIESDTGQLKGVRKLRGRDILSSAKVLKRNHLMFSALRPYLNKCFVLEGNEDAVGSTELFVCRAKQGVSIQLLKWYLLSKVTLMQTEWILSGTSYPRLDEGDFRALSVVLPDDYEDQAKIVDDIERQESEAIHKEDDALLAQQKADNTFEQLLLKGTFEATQ